MSDPRLYQRAFGAYPSHTQKDALDDELNGTPEEQAEQAELDADAADFDTSGDVFDDRIAMFRAEY